MLRRSVGGAECNVASGLVGLGVPAAWVSRVGDDPFGRYVLRDLAGRGVDVGAVQRRPGPADRALPQGPGRRPLADALLPQRFRCQRDGRGLPGRGPAVAAALAAPRLVHVSGITLGVVAEPAAFVDALWPRPGTRHGLRLSVDLNWRPGCGGNGTRSSWSGCCRWPTWCCSAPTRRRPRSAPATSPGCGALLGPRPMIVLKSDDHEAVSAAPDGRTVSVRALTVDVLDPIGAGDAFAAGYLAGTLDGRPAQQCLRLGHLTAATVLVADGDHAPAAPAAVREALLTCTDEQWAATVVRAGGIDSPALQRPNQRRPAEERSR